MRPLPLRGAFAAALMFAPLWACVDAGPPGSAVSAPSSPAAAAKAELPPPPRIVPPAGPVETVTTVGPGDTLYSLAREHDIAIRDLIEWNGLDAPYDLKPGQVLRLPPKHDHVVAVGDTVYSISRRYNVDMTALVRANGIAPPYAIAVGQKLKIPAETMAAETAAAETPATVPPAAAATVPPETVTAVPLPPLSAEAQPAPPSNGAYPAPEAKPDAKAGPDSKAEPVETAALPIAPQPAGETFLWPVHGRILSPFGPKKGGEHNDGINIEAVRGASVKAAAGGTVIYAGNELRGFGNLVLIKHADGWTTAYAHNDTLLVKKGAVVKRGQVIAKAGNTGSVTSPQVHFELRRGTRAVNPADYLTADISSAVNRVAGRDVPPNPE
jgi:murein DD-endopeptidase MepM/ murein hydrolase activator NlpD